ncbi:MAG: hypothetical protein J2P13_12975 [Acidobacteria bacterium]|nr:hypothetical protein [Acidobacteriota bacterium]
MSRRRNKFGPRAARRVARLNDTPEDRAAAREARAAERADIAQGLATEMQRLTRLRDALGFDTRSGRPARMQE